MERVSPSTWTPQVATSPQARIATWVRRVFNEATASNAPERTLRFVEEAVELAQAVGIDAATVHRLVDYVFGRPVGSPPQEVAGSMVTLYAAAVALGIDADAEFEREYERIQRPEVIERVQRRQAEKRAATVTADIPADNSEKGTAHEGDELEAVRSERDRLVALLPKCGDCDRIATRTCYNELFYCDAPDHGWDGLEELPDADFRRQMERHNKERAER